MKDTKSSARNGQILLVDSLQHIKYHCPPEKIMVFHRFLPESESLRILSTIRRRILEEQQYRSK